MSKSWGPGYFRSELFSPPPGLKAIKEQIFKRSRKHREIPSAPHFEDQHPDLRGRGRTTIHPFREGYASPKRCKTASDLPTTHDPRRDRS